MDGSVKDGYTSILVKDQDLNTYIVCFCLNLTPNDESWRVFILVFSYLYAIPSSVHISLYFIFPILQPSIIYRQYDRDVFLLSVHHSSMNAHVAVITHHNILTPFLHTSHPLYFHIAPLSETISPSICNPPPHLTLCYPQLR